MDRESLDRMDRDSLGNVIVEPMDRVVLDSTSVGNNMDSTGSPGNTPTPTGCVSPTMAPMMEVSFITGIIINIMMVMIINIIMIINKIIMMIRRKRRRSDQCCKKGGLPCNSW